MTTIHEQLIPDDGFDGPDAEAIVPVVSFREAAGLGIALEQGDGIIGCVHYVITSYLFFFLRLLKALERDSMLGRLLL